MLDWPISNDEEAIRSLVADAVENREAVLVSDQPSSMAQLLLVVARDSGVRVA